MTKIVSGMKVDKKTGRFFLHAGFRLFNPGTQKYLHFSGQSETAEVIWSWRGHRYQAATLKKRARARGETWPYIELHPDDGADQTGQEE